MREKNTIGILAYGSLINDPGNEIELVICEKILNVTTPFKIEFARKSRTRNYAPTLVPVDYDGATIKANILLLKNGIGLGAAKDLLWRRETRNENTDKHYLVPNSVGLNTMVVEVLENFNGIDYVLYTKLSANIDNLTASNLANLAITSAKLDAGKKGLDGISYLISAKENGILTPLMPFYENEILEKTGSKNLIDALKNCRMSAQCFNEGK